MQINTGFGKLWTKIHNFFGVIWGEKWFVFKLWTPELVRVWEGWVKLTYKLNNDNWKLSYETRLIFWFPYCIETDCYDIFLVASRSGALRSEPQSGLSSAKLVTAHRSFFCVGLRERLRLPRHTQVCRSVRAKVFREASDSAALSFAWRKLPASILMLTSCVFAWASEGHSPGSSWCHTGICRECLLSSTVLVDCDQRGCSPFGISVKYLNIMCVECSWLYQIYQKYSSYGRGIMLPVMCRARAEARLRGMVRYDAM